MTHFDHDDGLDDPCEKWDQRDTDHDVDRLLDEKRLGL